MKRCLLACLCGLLLAGCTRSVAPPASISAAPVIVDTAETALPGDTGTDAPPSAQGELFRVLFINVGYGDAALLCCGGRAMLIDTGEKTAAPQVFGALNYMGVDALDAVALTHTHSDHIGGLEAIARSMPVDRVYAATISENKKNGENKVTVLADKLGLQLTRLNAGDVLPLTEGLSFEVLGPLRFNAEDDNDNSLVLALSVNGRRLLFTGDMQFAEEATLLDAHAALKTDILKVGNHGNPDATSPEFGRAASPSVAVISTSTLEDDDSANPRVIDALSGAAVHVTENYPLGVLVSIDAAGKVEVSSPDAERSAVSLRLSLDAESQLLTVVNTGAQEADLSGFVLLSERGGECFRFPAGARLAAGGELTVAAAGGRGDYAFAAEDKPWNVKKGDRALLYDTGAHLIAEALC